MKRNIIIDVSSGVNPLGPSNKVKSSIRKSIKKINSGPCANGTVLERLFDSKFGLSPDKMLFANSLRELIYFIPSVLKPERVVIVGPALGIYEDASQSAGAEVLYNNASETDDFVFDISILQKNLKDGDLVFLANPNRISGKMIPREKISDIITIAKSGGPHFVIDESLIEFAGPFDYFNNLLLNGNLTILRTTALFYGMPGLELAYAVSSPEIIDLYRNKKHWEISTLTAEAAATAYKDSAYIKASKKYMFYEKKMITGMLKKIEWIKVYDTDANVILVRTDRDSEELAQILRRSGFSIRDCSDIKGLEKSYLILSVMKHEYNLRFISALRSFKSSI